MFEYRLGWTPLHCASHFGSVSAMELLINHRADIHARDKVRYKLRDMMYHDNMM